MGIIDIKSIIPKERNEHKVIKEHTITNLAVKIPLQPSNSKQKTNSIRKTNSHKDLKFNNKLFKENNFAARYKSPSPMIKKTKKGVNSVTGKNLQFKTPSKDDKVPWK